MRKSVSAVLLIAVASVLFAQSRNSLYAPIIQFLNGGSLVATIPAGPVKINASSGLAGAWTAATKTFALSVGAGSGILVAGSTVAIDPSVVNTATGTNTNTGARFDNSAVGQTAPARVSSSAPTSCVLGDMWIDTSLTAAGQTKVCTTAGTPGTFTVQGSTTTVKVPLSAATSVTGFNPADSTTYYWSPGAPDTNACNSSTYQNWYSIVSPVTGTITDLYVTATVFGTLGTTETVTYTLMKNCSATTLTATGLWSTLNPTPSSDSAHTVSVTKGDQLQMRAVTPAFATNPTTVVIGGWGVSITQ